VSANDSPPRSPAGAELPSLSPWRPPHDEGQALPPDVTWPRPVRPEMPPPRQRWGLAAALLVATFLTTTIVGAVWVAMARLDVSITDERITPWLSPTVVHAVLHTPGWLRLGLEYSLPLLFILLCHELGHYLMCRRYRTASTVPYFIPLPAALGTLGAFIRLRSLLPDRRKLFDMAVAGPLAGFVALLPFLVYGIARSPVVPITASPPGIVVVPGPNLLIWLLTRALHGPVPAGAMLNLHPFVIAAWVGLLATAINLLPVGQLDGGHILYALVGDRHRRIAQGIWLLIALGAFFYIGWLVWALLIRIIGVGHPPVLDPAPRLDGKRKALAAAALLVLVLSFTPAPQREVLVGPSAAQESGRQLTAVR